MKKIIVVVNFMTAIVFHSAAQKSPMFISSGSAIRGFDAVAYFKEGKAVKGNENFVFEWNDSKWNFSNQQNLDSFKTNPAKYAPQYGGYCAYGMYEGHKAPTDPNAWTIVNGKLYFNYSLKVRELWRDRSEAKIAIADKNWPAIIDKE